MRYYFAGAYVRRAELKGYADRMHEARISAVILSRWLTHDQSEADAGFSAPNLGSESARAAAWSYGRRDLEDIGMCQAIVSFTGEGTRGGRHVEYGFAISHRMHGRHEGQDSAMRLIVVGPREHVFHCHPATEVYVDFDEFLQHEIDRERN